MIEPNEPYEVELIRHPDYPRYGRLHVTPQGERYWTIDGDETVYDERDITVVRRLAAKLEDYEVLREADLTLGRAGFLTAYVGRVALRQTADRLEAEHRATQEKAEREAERERLIDVAMNAAEAPSGRTWVNGYDAVRASFGAAVDAIRAELGA